MRCENNDENGWGTFMELMDDAGKPVNCVAKTAEITEIAPFFKV